jgi:hypothetical protein
MRLETAMKTKLIVLLFPVLLFTGLASGVASAQGRSEHRIPHNGPPRIERRGEPHGGHAGGAPYVDGRGRWLGHVGREHYVLAHPWAHGRFTGGFGPRHVFRLGGGGCDRFWFDSFAFSVSPYEVGLGWCNGWLWDRDSIVVYEDPGDVGWYLAYNVRLGRYLHVEYLGGR